MTWVLVFVVVILLLVIAALGSLLAAKLDELDQRTAEFAQLRRRLERHQADDARLIDELWKQAQTKMARAERLVVRP
jgi:Tfp pilus assembly protein PilO